MRMYRHDVIPQAHFLKQQMIKQGLWDPPFITNLFAKDRRSKED